MCDDFEDFDYDGDDNFQDDAPFEDDLLEQDEPMDSEGIETDKEDYVGPGWQEIAVFGALSEAIADEKRNRKSTRQKVLGKS